MEFKENNFKLEEVGEYISALSNSAALNGQNKGYILWGVRDKTHDIVGTSVNPSQKKVGNEDLQNWLIRLLDPQIHFKFCFLTVDNNPIVLLEIDAGSHCLCSSRRQNGSE